MMVTRNSHHGLWTHFKSRADRISGGLVVELWQREVLHGSKVLVSWAGSAICWDGNDWGRSNWERGEDWKWSVLFWIHLVELLPGFSFVSYEMEIMFVLSISNENQMWSLFWYYVDGRFILFIHIEARRRVPFKRTQNSLLLARYCCPYTIVPRSRSDVGNRPALHAYLTFI